ncbi:MAG: hypothetical protein K5873_04030 [Treponema sp.]|nr:hypothetical protein [Treponema sp.]
MTFLSTKTKISFILSFIFLCQSVFALDSRVSSVISAEFGTPLPYAENKGDILESNIKADENLTVLAGDNVTFFTSAMAIYDAQGYQASHYDLHTDDYKLKFLLKEAWLDYTCEYWAVRIGRQIASWGKSDIIPVTNVLCPRTLTSLNIQDSSDTYLGIDAVRLSSHYKDYAFDFYWIPFVRSSVLPTSSNNPIQNFLTQSYGLDLKDSEVPERKLYNSEFAMKAAAYWRWGDASLYGFYGWDRIPEEFEVGVDLLNSSEGLYYLKGKHNRLLMLGADSAIPLGEDFVIRLDGAFFYNKATSVLKGDSINQIDSYFDSSSNTYVKKNFLKALAGLDWTKGAWVLSCQYYTDILLGEREQVNRDSFIHAATAAISRNFLKDTLNLSLAGCLQFGNWNYALAFLAKYNATDKLSFYAKILAFNMVSSAGEYLKDYNSWGGISSGIRFSF